MFMLIILTKTLPKLKICNFSSEPLSISYDTYKHNEAQQIPYLTLYSYWSINITKLILHINSKDNILSKCLWKSLASE